MNDRMVSAGVMLCLFTVTLTQGRNITVEICRSEKYDRGRLKCSEGYCRSLLTGRTTPYKTFNSNCEQSCSRCFEAIKDLLASKKLRTETAVLDPTTPPVTNPTYQPIHDIPIAILSAPPTDQSRGNSPPLDSAWTPLIAIISTIAVAVIVGMAIWLAIRLRNKKGTGSNHSSTNSQFRLVTIEDGRVEIAGSSSLVNALEVPPTPEMGADPETDADPLMGADPELGAGPEIGAGPEMGSDPELGAVPEMGADPELGAGPEMGSGPELGAVPEMGADPELGAVPEMDADPVMGAGPELGAVPEMVADPVMGAGPELGAVPEMDADPVMGAVPEMGTDREIGADPEMGADLEMGTDPEMGAGPQIGTGPQLGGTPRPLPKSVPQMEADPQAPQVAFNSNASDGNANLTQQSAGAGGSVQSTTIGTVNNYNIFSIGPTSSEPAPTATSGPKEHLSTAVQEIGKGEMTLEQVTDDGGPPKYLPPD